MGAAARAGARNQGGDVAGAVTEQGHGLAAKRGQHQFAGLALGHRLAGLRIDDLDEEMVFPEVHAVLVLALERHARAVHFRKAVGIVNVHAKAFLDLSPGFLGVRFGADERLAQREVAARVDAVLFQEVGEIKRVARGQMDERGPEILHQHQLPFGVAGAGGDDEAADFLRAVVRDQRAGEQAVGHHVLEHVLRGDAGHDEGTGAELGGVVHVLAREEERLRFAGGAAGGVQAQGGVVRHGQHAGGIVRAQIGAGGEGQPAQVGQRPDVFRLDVQFGELLPVEGHMPGNALDGGGQAVKLQLFQRVTAERFALLIPKHAVDPVRTRTGLPRAGSSSGPFADSNRPSR